MNARTTVHNFMGILSALISGSALLAMYQVPSRMSFAIALIVWWTYIAWITRLFSLGKKHMFLQVSTSVAFVSIQSLVEWAALHVFLIILGGLVFMFLWHWSASSSFQTTRFDYKVWRRIIMILWVFNVYAWFTALFALDIFFEHIPFVLLAVIGGCFGGLGASMIWNLYFKGSLRVFSLWIMIMGFIVFELMWSMEQLPLGYLTLGVLLTWIWYLIQLFVRFHLSPQGIIWRKQRLFLVTNTAAYGAVLYLVRWI